MSTRSGKRIHSTLFDNTEAVDSIVTKTEKKARKKRLKENDEHQDFAVVSSKIPRHYVVYPKDGDAGYTAASDAVEGSKSNRKTKKNTLKEHDINVPENIADHDEDKKTARVTRKTRKFAENIEAVPQNTEAEASKESAPGKKAKGKKNKKKKSKNSDVNENLPELVQDDKESKMALKKSKKKKKKGKHSNNSTKEVKQTLNKSNVANDSFHSAAGSPLTVVEDMDIDQSPESEKLDKTLVKEDNKSEIKAKKKSSLEKAECNNTFERVSKNRRSSLEITTSEQDAEPEINNTENGSKKKKKIHSKYTNSEKEDVSSFSNDLNSTYDKINVENVNEPNISSGKEPKARRSLRLNNSAIENMTDITNVEVSEKLNTTFEKDRNSRTSLRANDEDVNNISNILNTTFEKTSNKSHSKVISLDSTFNKSDPKLNTTFDKTERIINSEKSSLISSDEGTVNVTFDKDDNSKISITSDESKTDIIVNTTPLLVESSMDESLSTSKISENLEVSNVKTAQDNSLIQKHTLQLPITPLKREGTFTKESPDIKTNKTPTKRLTLPSPGYTPFHVTRNSNKEKSVLNVTRSLEKSQRSSLADLAPTRQTRVMFCSPVNNPAIITQQKKKVIKSSMKGSNKSFVFDDKAPSAPRPTPRKRSYTHNDADETRVKRTRLADDIQNSVDRLSRPRTSSAAAKLSDTTPSKAPTPSKAKSEPKRTKLPNFAALHQKQFEKMESLDECQLRKKQRARKLMMPKTPNGTVVVLERSSPRAKAEPTKPKEVAAKKPETPKKTETVKKAEIPTKLANLPTLESLRPGFTRFGFKMDTEFNPFSIPSKTEAKPKLNPEKPNGLTAKPSFAPKTPAVKPLTRQPSLPSLRGATARKEVAKQTVMREKSFTSLSGKRDVKRNESRTYIKGVRTNRRFELQMKMRNID